MYHFLEKYYYYFYFSLYNIIIKLIYIIFIMKIMNKALFSYLGNKDREIEKIIENLPIS